ncbi:YdjY domain-containing protein [Candidatus Uabimicrobium sp. HlEnr_7]|uniref:YdjY domain-containing protein n=1 Tax=Candidatus Uabimicrobium helgolandensis TaxID=3095367 RepID=UPI003557FEED
MRQVGMLIIFISCIYAQKNNIINLKGINVNLEQKTIEIDGVVNMNKGLVELLATAPGGKEHESVLKLLCNPSLLHTALLLLGLETGGGGKKQGDNSPIFGGEMYVYVSWKEKDKNKTFRAEKLVKNARTRKSMASCKWVFTGSRFRKDPRSGKSIYMANISGVLIATFYDPDAIVNNPLPERADDTVFYANNEILPKKGTAIKVTFSLKQLLKNESK